MNIEKLEKLLEVMHELLEEENCRLTVAQLLEEFETWE